MSIENTHLPKVPDFPPQGPANSETPGLPPQGPVNNETDISNGGGDIPANPYELLGGVPGDAQASAKNFQYPNSVDPLSAWTPEQRAAYLEILKKDPTFRIDPNDTTFVERLTEDVAVGDSHTTPKSTTRPSIQAGFSRQDEKQADGNAFVNFLKKPAGKITAGIAGLALVGSAVGLGIGIGAKDGNKTDTTPPDPSKTVASAPATAGAIETAPVVVYQPEVDPANCPTVENAPDSQAVVAPVSVVECGNFQELSPEQKQFVLKNEQMSVADFYKQPVQDQLKFANFVVENRANVGQTILNKNLTQMGRAQYGLVPNYEHSQNYQEFDNTAVGQMNATLQAIVYGSVTTDASGTIMLDKVTAKKMLAAFAVPGSEVFNALTSAIDSPRSVNNIFEINTGTGFGTFTLNTLGVPPTDHASMSVGDIKDVKTYTASIEQNVGTPVGVTGVAPTQFSSGLGFHDVVVSLVHSTNLDGTPKTNSLVSTIGPVQNN